MRIDGYKVAFAALVVGALVFGLALLAEANHPPTTDHGIDLANTGNEMNQESFWESYFGGAGLVVSCTKYESHNGFIPAQYEAAVIKSGSELVRVYEGGAPFTAIGPANPNSQHPNRRHTAPFSWVMKCNIETTTTTSTTSTSTTTSTPTTTTAPPSSTSSLPPPSSTTTTTDNTTTTTDPASTTTAPIDSTTTTLPPTTTSLQDTTTSLDRPVLVNPPTVVSEPPEELPYTGLPIHVWVVLALMLMGSGIALTRWAKKTT